MTYHKSLTNVTRGQSLEHRRAAMSMNELCEVAQRDADQVFVHQPGGSTQRRAPRVLRGVIVIRTQVVCALPRHHLNHLPTILVHAIDCSAGGEVNLPPGGLAARALGVGQDTTL